MSVLPDIEQQGLRDFLHFHDKETVAYDLAKLTCQNLLTPNSFQECVDLIVLHSPTTIGILNRKIITKGLLFKYLNDRKIAVNLDLSKTTLVEKVIRYWQDAFSSTVTQERHPPCTTPTPKDLNFDAHLPTSQMASSSEHFPIHQMARQFTTWFFERYNKNELTTDDVWPDAVAQIEMLERPNCVQEESAHGARSLVDTLLGLRQRFGIYFNPNVSHAGIQGRIDPHGLVLVLGCGTLHAPHGVVGCFECVFGLIRDPFTDNNWKVKKLRMRLNGSAATAANGLELLDLQRCETLQPMLALPSGDMDLE